MAIRADSTEYRRATVTADHDLTGIPIELALPTTGAVPDTWFPTTVEGVATTSAGKWTATYRILVGPDGGVVTLAAGSYDWTIRLTDNPERPVLKVGSFVVTAT